MLANPFNMKAITILAAIAAPVLGQHGAYFVLNSGQPLVTERLDPLLDPGTTSGHVHSVVGGNAFAATMDFAKTQTSTCSTIPVKADNSNYWMPSVYFHAKNGSFIRVPEQPYHKIYYKFGKGNNTPDLERSEFPQGFRMMTGTSSLRSDDGSFGTAGNQLNWQCHGSSTSTATGFPKGFTNCNGNYIGGLAATMRFPSCWSGADFDPTKPMAHMDFPTNADGLAGCRPGFQKARFVEIMIEYWLDTSSFDGEYSANDVPWVLSSGDPTGYGFHMDFLNGWKPGVLAQAIKGCDIGNTGDSLAQSQCFGANSLYTNDQLDACTIKPTVNEDIGIVNPGQKDGHGVRGGVLSALPGCNPVQSGPGPATKAACAGGTVPTVAPEKSSATSSAATVANVVSVSSVSKPVPVKPTTLTSKLATSATSATTKPTPTSGGGSSSGGSTSGLLPLSVKSTSGQWKAVGCYLDALNPRSLGKQPEWWGQQITSSNCVKHCDSIGAKYAGTENEGQCFCGNQLIKSASRPGKCTSKCNGDSKEICGGPGFLSLYSLDGKVSTQKRAAHPHHSRHFKGGI